MNYSIIERRNLEDSKIFKKQSASKIDFGIIKTITLSKIEIIISKKDTKKVINLISKQLNFYNNIIYTQ